MTDIREKIKGSAILTEKALISYCKEGDEELSELFDSERYSLLAGGKRIRPFIVNEGKSYR